jgi:large subunit ribosomal protein L30
MARRHPVAKKLKVTLVKSLIGLSPKQEATVRALGLKHIRQTVEHDDTPTIRGMIDAVPFAVEVAGREAAEGETSASRKTK